MGVDVAGGSGDNQEFALGGVNHLALVCSDMERTVEFYSGVLGMPLIKTIELPRGLGQHFFFDCGNGDCLAFFWFPTAPDGVPGVSAPAAKPGEGEIVSAVGSMNHVAFSVPPQRFDEYHAKLRAKGVEVGPVIHHDDSPAGVTSEMHDGVFVRSFYFTGPDGELLEFACWLRGFTEADVKHTPRRAGERTAPATV
jgi:catechol 2,3-dioxygenase-like lactoylglutathione lyase family enzyme